MTTGDVPRCLGLTGGIGAGKSTALSCFGAHGAATLSSDTIVHELYGHDDVQVMVRERFGADVFQADGSVDRARLGARAFAQENGIAFLEAMLFPRIRAYRDEWIAARRAESSWPLLVVEVPLLFEAGIADQFDAVIVITASETVRRDRVGARGQDFSERAELQWPEARKIASADHAYINDATTADLDAWVDSIYRRYAVSPAV